MKTRAELVAVAKWFKDAAAGSFRDPSADRKLARLSLEHEPSSLARRLVFWVYDARQNVAWAGEDAPLRWLCTLLADVAQRETKANTRLRAEHGTVLNASGVPILEQERRWSSFRLVLELVYAARNVAWLDERFPAELQRWQRAEWGAQGAPTPSVDDAALLEAWDAERAKRPSDRETSRRLAEAHPEYGMKPESIRRRVRALLQTRGDLG